MGERAKETGIGFRKEFYEVGKKTVWLMGKRTNEN